MRILITGGAGFIGANFVKYILKMYSDCNVIILDKLTYAGNLGTIKNDLKDNRVKFYKGDICNNELVDNIFMNHKIDTVVNFAAESHVDRSIKDPGIFLKNIHFCITKMRKINFKSFRIVIKSFFFTINK